MGCSGFCLSLQQASVETLAFDPFIPAWQHWGLLRSRGCNSFQH
jgi:hypothetical protein